MHFNKDFENILSHTAGKRNPFFPSTATHDLLASSSFVLTNQKFIFVGKV